MNSIKTSVRGVTDVVDRMSAFNDAFLKGELVDLANAAADIALAEIRSSAPVAPPGEHTPKGHKSGTLRDRGIGRMVLRRSSNSESVTVAIGFTKRGWYGIFKELGSRHQAPKPFVVPGFERKEPEILAMIGKVVSTGVDTWQAGGRAGFFKPRLL